MDLKKKKGIRKNKKASGRYQDPFCVFGSGIGFGVGRSVSGALGRGVVGNVMGGVVGGEAQEGTVYRTPVAARAG